MRDWSDDEMQAYKRVERRERKRTKVKKKGKEMAVVSLSEG